MATEATFQAAATTFDELATQMRAGFSTLDGTWSADVMVGGRLTRTIERALDATHGNTLSIVGQFQQLADECRSRAAICAEYTAALATYRRRDAQYEDAIADWSEAPTGSPPSPPSRPVRPAPWCDATTGGGGWQ